MTPQRSLENTRVIIFGGSSGLGFATAKAAAEEGATVVIISSRQNNVDNAVKALPGAEGHAFDLNSEEAIRSFFASAGRFDHLIYTAGENISAANVQDANIETSKAFFNIRFWGAFTVIKYGASRLNIGGSISLISGNFGQRPAKGYSLGAAICGMIDAFTRAMAVELAPIRVNNVAAGITKTALWSNMQEADRNQFFNSIENSVLLKRVGEADDIALAFVYLMKQSYMTGQSLIVDGGAVLV